MLGVSWVPAGRRGCEAGHGDPARAAPDGGAVRRAALRSTGTQRRTSWPSIVVRWGRAGSRRSGSYRRRGALGTPARW